MAEIKEKTYPIKLPKLKGDNAPQQEFYSVNGRDFIIKRGVTVEVPECVYRLMLDNEQMEVEAEEFVETTKNKSKEAKV